jgi:hypothetical protein
MSMSKQTNQHRRAFDLRNDLTTKLNELIDADSRVLMESSYENISVDDILRDMAEDLISTGWVRDWPDGGE